MTTDGAADPAAAVERIPEMHRYVVGLFRRVADRPAVSQDEVERIQTSHQAYLERLRRAGDLVAHGSVEEESDLREFVVFREGPIARVRPLVENAPEVVHGRLAVELFTWYAVAGLRVGPPTAPEPADEP